MPTMGAWTLGLAGEGAGVATEGPGKPRVTPTATESVWPQRTVMLGVQVHGSAPRSEAERPAETPLAETTKIAGLNDFQKMLQKTVLTKVDQYSQTGQRLRNTQAKEARKGGRESCLVRTPAGAPRPTSRRARDREKRGQG